MTPLHFSRSALLASTMMLASALATSIALAADEVPKHLRGTITAVNASSFTVASSDGDSHKVTLNDDTRLAGVVPSSLDQIEKGTFIGTANVEDGESARALEVVIFPESMKGTGLGDYAWDLSPKESSTADSGNGQGAGGSAMTNGTVTQSGEGSGDDDGAGGSSMTNGTVNQANGSGSMTLDVDYGDGSKQIVVPKDVPVVAVQKATQDDLKKGAAVFVAGDMSQSPIKAKMVIVGIDGTVPPM